MQKRIEISADIKNFQTAFRTIMGSLNNLKKMKVSGSIFSKEDTLFVQEAGKKNIRAMAQEIVKFRQVAKDARNSNDMDLFSRATEAANNLKKELLEVKEVVKGGFVSETEVKKVEKLAKVAGAGGTSGGGGKKSLMLRAMQEIPGIGGLATAIGAGPTGMLLAGVGAIGYRGYRGYQQRMGEVEPRLALAGAMGAEKYEAQKGKLYQGAKYGYDINETLQQANQLVRDVGNIGQLDLLQKTSRAYGMDFGQLSGEAGMLRKIGGQGNVEKNFQSTMAGAVASGLDQSLMSEYMENASNMIEQLATDGMPNIDEMNNALSGLVRQGGIFEDSRRTATRISGFDSMIKNAEGAKLGFFSQAYQRMLGPKASGEQVLTALNQGLFGADTSRYNALSKKEKSDFQLGGFEKRRGAIGSSFDALTKKMSTYGKGFIASQLTGIQDSAEALNFIKAIKSGKFNEKQLRKMEADLKKSPMEKTLDKLLATTDGGFAKINATNVNQLSVLGEQIAPTVKDIQDTLLEVENGVLIPIAESLGASVKTSKDEAKEISKAYKKGGTKAAVGEALSFGKYLGMGLMSQSYKGLSMLSIPGAEDIANTIDKAAVSSMTKDMQAKNKAESSLFEEARYYGAGKQEKALGKIYTSDNTPLSKAEREALPEIVRGGSQMQQQDFVRAASAKAASIDATKSPELAQEKAVLESLIYEIQMLRGSMDKNTSSTDSNSTASKNMTVNIKSPHKLGNNQINQRQH